MPDDVARLNGAHSSPAYDGSENRSTPSRTIRSPTRVPPPALAVDRLPVVGVARPGVPVGVDHQVGDRGGRQDRVVATGGQVDPAGAPARGGCATSASRASASTSAKSRVAPPTQALCARSAVLAVQA